MSANNNKHKLCLCKKSKQGTKVDGKMNESRIVWYYEHWLINFIGTDCTICNIEDIYRTYNIYAKMIAIPVQAKEYMKTQAENRLLAENK